MAPVFWWIGGGFLWVTVGAILVGVDNALTDHNKRIFNRPDEDSLGLILFCVVVWPVVFILVTARLTSDLIDYIRDNSESSPRKSLVHKSDDDLQ